ncbi:MAG: drug/metabolite transporter (DMT)-like permease [Marinobacter maritimus]|jgi:drug/metabolite transporter (DMT)-like permease
MGHIKRFNISTKQLCRMTVLLFIVLLSGHLWGNELPAQWQSDKINWLELDQQPVIQYRSLLAIDQKQFHPIFESRINQAVKGGLLQGNTIRLPKAGMASDLYKKIGFWMLLLAALFWIVERHFIPVKTDNQDREGEWHY